MTSPVATWLLATAFPETAWKWIHRLGGLGLILPGIADSAPFVDLPPGIVDVLVVAFAADRRYWWAYYAIIATIGEVIGGYWTFRLAEKGGQATLEKKVGKNRAEKIYKTFEKYGSATVLVSAMLPLPFPFTRVLITAGVMQYPKSKFLPALTTGRLLPFLAAAGLGRIYGRQIINVFATHYHFIFDLLVAVALFMGISAAVYFTWYRPKSQRKKQGPSFADVGIQQSSTARQRRGTLP
jgi:membrane protein YqaA with SNARE-associated domain